jgi:hypothetical protein
MYGMLSRGVKSVLDFICGFVIAWPVEALLPHANEWETALEHDFKSYI